MTTPGRLFVRKRSGGVRNMPEPSKPDPDRKTPPMRRLEETIEKMSIAELFKLFTDISVKIRNLKQRGG